MGHKYSNIGYVPAERRLGIDGTLSNGAYRILMILKGMARWKKQPEFMRWGAITIPLSKGEGYFSQVKLSEYLGWHPRTIRYCLQELEFRKLITWQGDEYGTRFKVLVEARQFDHRPNRGGGVDHYDRQINKNPYFKQYSYVGHSYKSNNAPQNMAKREKKVEGYVDISGVMIPVMGYA